MNVGHLRSPCYLIQCIWPRCGLLLHLCKSWLSMVKPICILVTTGFYKTLTPFTHVDTDMNAMPAAFSLCIQAHGSDVISLHLSAHLVLWNCNFRRLSMLGEENSQKVYTGFKFAKPFDICLWLSGCDSFVYANFCYAVCWGWLMNIDVS